MKYETPVNKPVSVSQRQKRMGGLLTDMVYTLHPSARPRHFASDTAADRSCIKATCSSERTDCNVEVHHRISERTDVGNHGKRRKRTGKWTNHFACPVPTAW